MIPRQRQFAFVLRRALLALSALLAGFIAWSYFSRADALAATTVFPVWCWAIPGGLLTGLGWKGAGRYAAAVALAWLVIMVAFADQPAKLVLRQRSSLENEQAQGKVHALRVVSLNCNGGERRAVTELAELQPDIVLLQESPARPRLEELARQWYGEQDAVVWSADASIIARGRLTPLPLPRAATAYAVRARLELDSGQELEIVSLRLEPGLVRADLWAPDCWREQTENRRKRRKQLEAILAPLAASSRNAPLILGGDFNAPPGDAIFRLLSPLALDAFVEAGRGWGNTIVNQFPVLRIDQIWIGGKLRATDAYAVATQHSDHRAVVCDLLFK
jgi:endonuclease/exonuclease/phosphatase (EEP) superfamily protein YafD